MYALGLEPKARTDMNVPNPIPPEVPPPVLYLFYGLEAPGPTSGFALLSPLGI